MKLANQEIRNYMKEKKVPTWAVGSKMGIHENTVYRKLRFELSDEEKAEIIKIVDEIASEE